MTETFQIPHYSFDEVVERLKASSDVLGVLAMGSTGQPSMKPYSDYDLAIILGKNAPALFTASTWINHQLGDLYFFSQEEITELLTQKQVTTDTFQKTLFDWVRTGTILYDPQQLWNQLRNLAPQDIQVNGIADKIHASWFGVNFNFAHNKRYFNSDDERYREALEFRLQYCTYDLLIAYFTLRELSWQGDKSAIIYLQKHDPEFLALFRQTIRQNQLDDKFHTYSSLVEKVLIGYGGIWADDDCSVLMKNAPVEEGLEWLRDLFSGQRYQK